MKKIPVIRKNYIFDRFYCYLPTSEKVVINVQLTLCNLCEKEWETLIMFFQWGLVEKFSNEILDLANLLTIFNYEYDCSLTAATILDYIVINTNQVHNMENLVKLAIHQPIQNTNKFV